MKQNTEGISVGIVRVNNEFFLKIVPHGKLTHKDYEMMVPLIENSLLGVKEPKINALIDAREFEGWDIKAAWDDLKFGLKHSKEFQKIAIVGEKKYEYIAKISNWFISGEVKYFPDLDSALEWIVKKESTKKNLDAIEKEFESRKDEIKNELKFLFKANMKITGWDVPEADNKKAAKILHNILQEALNEIKEDIKNNQFDY